MHPLIPLRRSTVLIVADVGGGKTTATLSRAVLGNGAAAVTAKQLGGTTSVSS